MNRRVWRVSASANVESCVDVGRQFRHEVGGVVLTDLGRGLFASE